LFNSPLARVAGGMMNDNNIAMMARPEPENQAKEIELQLQPQRDAIVVPRVPKMIDLVLHAGASKVERAEVEIVPTPDATDTWTPIPHIKLIELVEETLVTNGLKIISQVHSLTKSGLRYFGMMQVQNGASNGDHAWVLGTRNSHDKSFPGGLVAGMGVFVCDNLSFSGQVKFIRKHTRFIVRDLPGLVQRAVGRLVEHWHDQDARLEAYKNAALTNPQVNDLMIRALDTRAVTVTEIPRVLKEWRKPQHVEFEPRTAWSLLNSFTEVFKGQLRALPMKTERLHGLLDNYVGLHGKN
jgi:hypothetical protein